MIWFIEFAYIVFCYWLADDNAQRIADNKRIRHALQGFIHIASGIIFSLIFNWWMLPLILLSTRLWFTSFLNHFRELPFFYVTPTPESFTDKIEQKIFHKSGLLPFIFYFVSWVLVNFYATN